MSRHYCWLQQECFKQELKWAEQENSIILLFISNSFKGRGPYSQSSWKNHRDDQNNTKICPHVQFDSTRICCLVIVTLLKNKLTRRTKAFLLAFMAVKKAFICTWIFCTHWQLHCRHEELEDWLHAHEYIKNVTSPFPCCSVAFFPSKWASKILHGKWCHLASLPGLWLGEKNNRSLLQDIWYLLWLFLYKSHSIRIRIICQNYRAVILISSFHCKVLCTKKQTTSQ